MCILIKTYKQLMMMLIKSKVNDFYTVTFLLNTPFICTHFPCIEHILSEKIFVIYAINLKFFVIVYKLS